MIIELSKPFKGQHCETTATGTLLNSIERGISEPMLFGIGEGLSYLWWNAKNMDVPFLGGRAKPEKITEAVCKNLNLSLSVKETASVSKAWSSVKESIEAGIVVGLKLDCYHLEYFTKKIHFAAHYVAIYGYDDTYAYLIDTKQQGSLVKTSLESLAKARNERGALSSKNLSYTISAKEERIDIGKAATEAIKRNAEEYLHPPIQNISYKGVAKTGREMKKWFLTSGESRAEGCKLIAVLMERGGTGGALFRNFYHKFLSESAEITRFDFLQEAATQCKSIAKKWNRVSSLFNSAGELDSITPINEAEEILTEIAEREREMMLFLKEKL